MLLVISGTNRPGAYSLQVARLMVDLLREAGAEARLLDLAELPPELFRPEAYAAKPAAFGPFQAAIDGCEGLLVVVPEYNGSFPGVLKYFVDMLAFPRSLAGLPCAFVGVASGTWGGLRAVEQLQMVFQYRHAHLYSQRVFLPNVTEVLGPDGRLLHLDLHERLQAQATGFVRFARQNRRAVEAT